MSEQQSVSADLLGMQQSKFSCEERFSIVESIFANLGCF